MRFDINASSLPDFYKERLKRITDRRLSNDGVIIIKAQRHRSQEKNREDALARLKELILSAAVTPKTRMATKPSKASRTRRLEGKTQRGKLKVLRRSIDD